MLDRLWKNQAARAFDQWSSTYAEIAEKKIRDRGYSYTLLAQFIWDRLRWPAVGTVVELGTGPGVSGQRMSRPQAVTLVGIDISPEMLKRIPPGVYTQAICASAESVPLPTSSVIGVFSTFMLHSIQYRWRAIQEMRRILVPGGVGVIVDLFPATSGLPVLSPVLRFFHSLRHEAGAPANYVTVDCLTQELTQEGLEVLQVEELGLPKSYRHVAVTFQRPFD